MDDIYMFGNLSICKTNTDIEICSTDGVLVSSIKYKQNVGAQEVRNGQGNPLRGMIMGKNYYIVTMLPSEELYNLLISNRNSFNLPIDVKIASRSLITAQPDGNIHLFKNSKINIPSENSVNFVFTADDYVMCH